MDSPHWKQAEKRQGKTKGGASGASSTRKKRTIEIPAPPQEEQKAAHLETKRRKRAKQVKVKEENKEEEEAEWYSTRPQPAGSPEEKEAESERPSKEPKTSKKRKQPERKTAKRTVPAPKPADAQEPAPKKRKQTKKGKGKEAAPQSTSSSNGGAEEVHSGERPDELSSDGKTRAVPSSSPSSSPKLSSSSDRGDFRLTWQKLLEPSQPPTPSTDDLAEVVKRAKLKSLFTQKELDQTRDDFPSLSVIEDKLDRIQKEVKDGAALVLSLWGSKGVGKSWTANAIVNRLLKCNLPLSQIGSLPIPSFSGMGDGSPWPIFIRLLPSIDRIHAYRELCNEETYVMRVKSELATQNSLIAEEYGCTGVDDEISLNKEDEIGEKLSSMFSNTEPIWDSKEGGPLGVVDCLKKIRNALDQLREAPPYENLVTNYCVIEIPHPLGIELRDIPGIGHGDWRWARDCDAVRGTDIACVVFFTRLTAGDLDKLHQCQLYSEQNFIYDHPPKLVMLPNITLKHKEGVAPDSILEGDQQPYVQLIKQTVIESLQPNKRMAGALMWDGMDEDIRTEMLAKTREGAEVIPFYPGPVKLTTGEDFDSVKLLQAIIERQKAGKIQNMCMVGMRLARTWLFHAWPSVAKINKAAKKIENSALKKEIDKFVKSLKSQYIPGLVAKLEPNEEAIEGILNKVLTQIMRTFDKPRGSLNKPASTLSDKELRTSYLYKIQDHALREIIKEVDHWLKRRLKSIKPLRRVMVQDIKSLFKLPETVESKADDQVDDGLSGAKFPLTQLQTQEEEVFRGLEEWIGGKKFVARLQSMSALAWGKVIGLYFKEKRTRPAIREVIEQVLHTTIEYIMHGDPFIRMKKSITTMVRERMTYSGRNQKKLSYFNDIKQLIEALSVTPDQLEDMSKRKKEKLNDLHKELAKHGAAAPKGAKKSIYYNPNIVRATLDALRQTTHKIAQVKSNKAADPPSGALSPDASQRPKLNIVRSSPKGIISVTRTNEGGYEFHLKQSVLDQYVEFVQEDEGRLQCPIIATMMELKAMARLWPCIHRLDQFEPEHGSKYFMFVVVPDEDKQKAQTIFKDCETTYLIILPPPAKDNKGKQKKNEKNKKKQQLIEKQQHELLEVAKQFGEAMGERLQFRYFYVLLESVEFIREYDSKQCQMVPSTYYRAFQEGIRVYKYLEMKYQSEMTEFLQPALLEVGGLCETKEILQQQQKLLTNPKAFNVQELLDILPSPDSFKKQMAKLKKRINTKQSGGKKSKKLDQEYLEIERKHDQLVSFLKKVESYRGEYRIGPICISNWSNGDNKMNHVRLGTYFLTKKAVTNMVLFNIKSMQPYRVFNPTRRGPASQKPLSIIVPQMWDHGRPAVIVFNFEYKDKAPGQAVAALDSEAIRQMANTEIKEEELEADDAHRFFGLHGEEQSCTDNEEEYLADPEAEIEE